MVVNLSDAQYEKWWVKYWYFPTAYSNVKLERESIPNFKDMNEVAISLVDEETRIRFVKECMAVIDIELKQLFV